MDENRINSSIHEILTHESVSRDAGISKEVQPSYEYLLSAGEESIPHIVSALLKCASGRGVGMWWYGAEELCKILSKYQTLSAKQALLTILKTDSKIVEYDRVRHEAATQLGTFNDAALIPELLAASETPNAPALAIKKVIETLGGEMPESPELILKEGRSIMRHEEAINFYSKHQSSVSTWPKENQGAFYWFFGKRINNVKGMDAALPYYAASLSANPHPDAAAWHKFPNSQPSPQNARYLVSVVERF